MRPEKSLKRIAANITSPTEKSKAMVATMYKGVVANGCCLVFEVYQKY